MSLSREEHLDPRLSVIPKRLSSFKHVILVVSPKGGVGKTTVSIALALAMGRTLGATALLDLDLTNPTTHIVLGLNVEEVKVEEDKGVLPLKVPGENVELMSLAFFTKGRLLPLRGKDVVNVVRELLSITRWRSSILVVDTPPGFSDEVMEFSKLTPRAKFLVISTPDPLSIASTLRVVEHLKEEKQIILGVVGNMCRGEQDLQLIRESVSTLDIEVLTCLPWVNNIHKYYGRYNDFLTLFEKNLSTIIDKLSRVLV